MKGSSRHGEWLSLMEVSGPFLAEPVLNRAFPQGLELIDTPKRKTVRQAYDEWREAIDTDDQQLPELHTAWIDLVLKRILEFDEDGEEDILKPQAKLPETLSHLVPEFGITMHPDYAVVEERKDDRPLLIIQIYPPETSLDKPIEGDGWVTSLAERMVELCRATNVRLGLLTNGEQWMLIDAPVGAATTFASWYARLWGQEPITLQSFVNLLGIRRFFVDPSERLPALLDESLKLQEEVTDALGEQVRRAVEVLIQALDRADVDRNRELLEGVEPPELYEAGLTIMMRIVFLLSAEERGLLLMGDERYEANYAVSTLRMQLRAESEEILERRWDAWSRLLSIFRAVYGGVQHETLRLPALGGSLFDPDRFPFLEGRAKGSNWKIDPATPLPIDNRTVLLLLDAVQLFQGRTLSYRALDVEQIGYVYEGLLERTVVRASEVTLDLNATKNAKKPWVMLDELEVAEGKGDRAAEVLLQDRTGSSASRVKNDLAKKVDEAAADKLLTACHGDQVLRDRIKSYFHLLRMDRWGYPLVYPEDTFMVTTGADRRETGTHYTPKSLTEAIVKETLEPVVYVGPAEGKPREVWSLKTPSELLDLKICDPAMGSGAFLVQACRWLSERLVEAWEKSESAGNEVTSEGVVVEKCNGNEPLRNDAEERLLTAKRLIAERCLYGVDINPLAVELAKLSIWLMTLAKERPFGFLDHNLRSGDSLLGINDLEQLRFLDMTPDKGSSRKLFSPKIDRAVEEVIKLRIELRSRPIRDIRDVEFMTKLNDEAIRVMELPEIIADALLGEALAASGRNIDTSMLSIEAGGAMDGDTGHVRDLKWRGHDGLSTDLPVGKLVRLTFHWPLEFPEVFMRENSGFDAIVGNPPFLGGKRIATVFGKAYREYLVCCLADGNRGSADLVVYFFLRAFSLLRSGGDFGLLAVNTIAEGESRKVGLERIIRDFGATIYAAYPNEPWPGKAAVVTSRVHVHRGDWTSQATLSGKSVSTISAFLSDREEWTPKRLLTNENKAFIGSFINGIGFTLTEKEARAMIKQDSKNEEVLFPYLNGKDLNSHQEQKPSRWVVNFWDWPEAKARQYELPYTWIMERIYPERLEKSKKRVYKNIMSNWWLHWNNRPGLYHAIGRGYSFSRHPKGWNFCAKPMGRVLVTSEVSKIGAVAFVENNTVFSHMTIVFVMDQYKDFAFMQSTIHGVWARKQASSLETRLRYTPSDIFKTFPFPLTSMFPTLQSLGEKYHTFRSMIMCNEGVGLTKLYNRFHDCNDDDQCVDKLRDLHRQIDEEVANAYGWADLPLDHNFHVVGYLPENDNIRFTISEAARIEVLHRLSELNRERYEAEQVHSKSKTTKRQVTARDSAFPIAMSNSNEASTQTDLFKADSNSAPVRRAVSDPVEQIYEWVEKKERAWISKQAILSGTGVDVSELDKVISKLIADEDLEQKGEGDHARYRAKV